MSNSMGERIRARRKAKGFTLDRLAELSSSSKSYVWELENKNPPRPSAEKIMRIAEALDTTSDYLLGVDTEEGGVASEDRAFFRKYQGMSLEKRKQARKMLDIFDEDDE